MKKLLLTIVGLFMFSMSLLAQEKAAGGGGNCPECDCTGLFSSCTSGPCCPPNLPDCSCNVFTATCGCKGRGTTGMKGILNVKNVNDLILYVGGNEFSSSTSQQLKMLLNEWVTFYQKDNVVDFLSTGESIESAATKLPQSEKQKINAWIQSKGGSVLIK